MTRLLTVLLLMAVFTQVGRCDDVEKAEEQIEKAKEKYVQLMTVIRTDLVKQIDAQEALERKKSNSDLDWLSQLKDDRTALEQNWDIPGWIDAKSSNRILKAREPLIVAMTKAKSAYTRANQEAKAAKLEAEMWRVLSKMPPAFESAKRGELVLEVRRDGNILKFAANGTFTGTGGAPYNRGTWRLSPASQMHVVFADGVTKGVLEQSSGEALDVGAGLSTARGERWHIIQRNR